MTEKVIIAGAGGQGIMLLGKVLSEAAMRESKYVTWLPCYGAEVRGGTANCMVIISDKEISSPYINQADSLIIMNEPSLQRFKSLLKNKGLLIVSSSPKHTFTDIAIKLGNIKVANMVALGCYLRSKKIIHPNSVMQVIEDMAPLDKKELIKINQQALKEGMKLNDQG